MRFRKGAPFPTNGRDKQTGLPFQPRQQSGRAGSRRNLHGQWQKRRVSANRSNANRKKRDVESGKIPNTWTALHIGRCAPEGFGRRGRFPLPSSCRAAPFAKLTQSQSDHGNLRPIIRCFLTSHATRAARPLRCSMISRPKRADAACAAKSNRSATMLSQDRETPRSFS